MKQLNFYLILLVSLIFMMNACSSEKSVVYHGKLKNNGWKGGQALNEVVTDFSISLKEVSENKVTATFIPPDKTPYKVFKDCNNFALEKTDGSNDSTKTYLLKSSCDFESSKLNFEGTFFANEEILTFMMKGKLENGLNYKWDFEGKVQK